MISPNGTSARVLAAAEEGRYELVLSTRLLSELEDVLRREKFRRYLPIESVPLFLSRLALAASRASGGPLPYNPPYEEGEIVPVSADPKDDYLVALAVASGPATWSPGTITCSTWRRARLARSLPPFSPRVSS